MKNEVKVARISMLIVFLALIRTVAEPLRLEHNSASALQYQQVKPFIVGGLVAAVSLVIMTLLSFSSKFKLIIALSIITVIALVVVKGMYHV